MQFHLFVSIDASQPALQAVETCVAPAKRTAAVDDATVEAAANCGCERVRMATQGHGALGDARFGCGTKTAASRSKLPARVLH